MHIARPAIVRGEETHLARPRQRIQRHWNLSAHRLALLTGTFATIAVGARAEAPGLDLDLYAALLRDHTTSTAATAGTLVDYRAVGDDPRWTRLLAGLEAARPSDFTDADERMAFWINAYNILAIRMVVEHAPLESIRDAGSLIWPVWRREIARIEGARVTLHQIEHDILRKLGDPRIHAAIVCASTSCPSLAREPYRAEDLARQLDDAVHGFLADPRKGLRIDRSSHTVWLSKIFRWFSVDFEAAGGVLAFTTRYAPPPDRTWLPAQHDIVEVEYLDYDWRLNEWRR